MKKFMVVVFFAGSLLLAYFFFFEKEQPVLVSDNSEHSQNEVLTTQNAPQTATLQTGNPEPSNAKSTEKKPDQHAEVPQEDRAQLEARYESANTNSDYPSLESKLREIYQRRPDADFSESEVVDAVHRSSAWERLEEKPAGLSIPEQQKPYDTEFIRFDRMKIETLSVGDTMEIPVVHTGETYVMQIDEVITHVDDNITWRGSYTHQGQNFHISFTQNTSGLTVGGMNTPNGHYTLEAHNENGWVVSSNAGLQASSEPDYIIPDYE